MHHSNVNISVLILFHARPDHFSRVWEEVRKARPARLFLYQDGPRPVDKNGKPVADAESSKDWPGIQACRILVSDENIDWECEVHRNYQTRNAGCDPSGFNSQSWAFSLTDKCIVLEDDVVPSQSFFQFCKEMLDRYENDERITMIAGFNTDESTATEDIEGASYFFTRAFSIWGWASWARVVNNWDPHYCCAKDLSALKSKVDIYSQRKDMIPLLLKHSKTGIPFFETIFWSYMMLHDGMAIMPKVNMINNIGLDGGTHYSTQLRLQPKRLRRQFEMKRLELDFPLSHPQSIIEYKAYQERLFLLNAWNHPWRKIQYSIEELYLNMKAGNFKNILDAFLNRMIKTICR